MAVSDDEAAGTFRAMSERVERRRRVTSRGPVTWIEYKEVCSGGPIGDCRSPAYMLVSGEPRCLAHAFGDVLDLLMDEAEFSGSLVRAVRLPVEDSPLD